MGVPQTKTHEQFLTGTYVTNNPLEPAGEYSKEYRNVRKRHSKKHKILLQLEKHRGKAASSLDFDQ